MAFRDTLPGLNSPALAQGRTLQEDTWVGPALSTLQKAHASTTFPLSHPCYFQVLLQLPIPQDGPPSTALTEHLPDTTSQVARPITAAAAHLHRGDPGVAQLCNGPGATKHLLSMCHSGSTSGTATV